MMDFPLTLAAIFRHVEQVHPRREVVTRRVDGSLHRYCYTEFGARVRRLVNVFRRLGVLRGDRVATLGWNHHQHLEAYFAVPLSGVVLHTLNLRLHPDELAFIVNDAEDRVVLVDESLLPLWQQVASRTRVEWVVVVGATGPLPPEYLDYEGLLADAEPADLLLDFDERTAAVLCYTTGTTGRPKGVLYSHRALVLHTFAVAMPSGIGISEADAVLPVVPMFHANAWGLPYAAVMAGAKMVMPGPRLDAASLVDLFARERVTVSAGVPTIWMGVLQHLDAHRGAHDLSALRALFVGGAAAPQTMIEAFEHRHGLRVVHAWGMTETTPLGTVSHVPALLADATSAAVYEARAKQGRPAPFVEIRARNESGLVPWDGRTMGELEVRGPWVASGYYRRDDCGDRFTDDGWFRTGDIVTIDAHATVSLQDRARDLIKSGGEWISSVALESALMGHPAVAEAAVIGVASERWTERPLAAVVVKPGMTASPAELRAFLAPRFPKFWLPDAIVYLDTIPRTSAGKFQKSELRARFRDYRCDPD
jgi:fatty-acyl-CoA synthase